MSPTTIAIVPAPEWREALLGDGPCGSRAPKISLHPGGWHEGTDEAQPPEWEEGTTWDKVALPLLWEGQPLPDGIARAVRAVYHHYAAVEGLPHYGPKGEASWIDDGPAGIHRLAAMLSRLGIAAEVIEVSDG